MILQSMSVDEEIYILRFKNHKEDVTERTN